MKFYSILTLGLLSVLSISVNASPESGHPKVPGAKFSVSADAVINQPELQGNRDLRYRFPAQNIGDELLYFYKIDSLQIQKIEEVAPFYPVGTRLNLNAPINFRIQYSAHSTINGTIEASCLIKHSQGESETALYPENCEFRDQSNRPLTLGEAAKSFGTTVANMEDYPVGMRVAYKYCETARGFLSCRHGDVFPSDY